MKTDSIPVGSGISQLGHKLSEFLKSTNIKHQNNPNSSRQRKQQYRCKAVQNKYHKD